MYKLIGTAIVIAAASAIGWVQSASYAARPRQLRQLIVALQRLETSIVYGHTPLDDAFEELGTQLSMPLNSLFAVAASNMKQREALVLTSKEAWHQALKRVTPETALKHAEIRVLHDLGMSLGISDREDQRNHIRHAIKRLEQEEINAREDYMRYGTLSRSLGLLSGVLVVILIY
ncbi:stage III sporulation protein SpoIIIAB [Paenibacillus taiwanensis]|uniref:stage III sporulation protein SpoIIIAB n=1 Tax=Paenibacillus taiwanensis TaxID=401638 RepID=UPI000413AF5D|nr:stage III sporulation protein SpoIIIAB [Paenibacillus taiwanensis]